MMLPTMVLENVCTPVKVCAASVRAKVQLVAQPVSVTPSVPSMVIVLRTENVLPFVRLKVPVLPVIVRPLMLVAVAAPRTGVTKVGEVARTTLPVPVEATKLIVLGSEVPVFKRNPVAGAAGSVM